MVVLIGWPIISKKESLYRLFLCNATIYFLVLGVELKITKQISNKNRAIYIYIFKSFLDYSEGKMTIRKAGLQTNKKCLFQIRYPWIFSNGVSEKCEVSDTPLLNDCFLKLQSPKITQYTPIDCNTEIYFNCMQWTINILQ